MDEMALPSGNEMQTQVLKSLQDQNAPTLIEVKESIAKRFNVSETERKKISSKRARPIFDSKIVQVLSKLRKDGLIVNETRGVFKITKNRVRRVLKKFDIILMRIDETIR